MEADVARVEAADDAFAVALSSVARTGREGEEGWVVSGSEERRENGTYEEQVFRSLSSELHEHDYLVVLSVSVVCQHHPHPTFPPLQSLVWIASDAP